MGRLTVIGSPPGHSIIEIERCRFFAYRQDEVNHHIPMAPCLSVNARKWTGTEENHASSVFSCSYCQFQKVGGSFGSLYLHVSQTLRDGEVAQIWHPAITRCAH